MKIKWMVTGLSLAVMLTFTLGAAKKNPASSQPVRNPSKAQPWNGGKPSIPVTVVSDVEGPIPADTDQTVRLVIVVEQPCVEMQMQVRTIDGVVLVSSPDLVDFGACKPGEEIEHQVVVRAPTGVSGLLVLDLEFKGFGEGVPPDERRSVTKAITIAAEGARFRNQSSNKMGFTGKSESSAPKNGSGVVEMGNRRNVR